jgi:hypothetical protein
VKATAVATSKPGVPAKNPLRTTYGELSSTRPTLTLARNFLLPGLGFYRDQEAGAAQECSNHTAGERP